MTRVGLSPRCERFQPLFAKMFCFLFIYFFCKELCLKKGNKNTKRSPQPRPLTWTYILEIILIAYILFNNIGIKILCCSKKHSYGAISWLQQFTRYPKFSEHFWVFWTLYKKKSIAYVLIYIIQWFDSKKMIKWMTS